MRYTMLAILSLIAFSSCNTKRSGDTDLIRDEKFQKELQEKFILLEDGGTVELPAGKYLINKPLSLEGKKNITIRGKGAGKTVLSFLGQTDGAEGINVANCDNVKLEDFTVQDSKGDNIKLKNCNNIEIRGMNSTWTTGTDSANGNYGYYPVECHGVLLEGCEVSYCADAGIYVGQSYNVTIRNCHAHNNVCGIEIENCINSDVYENYSHDNTGGIVVYDLPGLPLKDGKNCRVYRNKIESNNNKNFARPGSYVSDIPPGSGIIIMAYDSVQVFKNSIINNKTVGCCAVSYQATGRPINDSLYTPYCTCIFIHDNTFERKALLIPDLKSDLGKLILATSKSPADLIYDGNYSKEMSNPDGSLKQEYRSCFTRNGDIKFLNMNAWHSKEIRHVLKTYDNNLAPFDCSISNINGNNNR